ncbi:MAG: hypothetical protein ACRDRL_09950 [Sciscionella sp.]
MSSNVVDSLPVEFREVLVETLQERDPALLASLRVRREPTLQEREAVEEILADAFTEHFGPGHEPTERGKAVDNTLGAFLTQWPIEEQ